MNPAAAIAEPQQSAFDSIAARASQKPVTEILNDPETARRLEAINRGERP
jgi:hypothetical protein